MAMIRKLATKMVEMMTTASRFEYGNEPWRAAITTAIAAAVTCIVVPKNNKKLQEFVVVLLRISIT